MVKRMLDDLTKDDIDKKALASYIRSGITSPKDLGPLISYVPYVHDRYCSDSTLKLNIGATEIYVDHA